jgi:hypothetical protein
MKVSEVKKRLTADYNPLVPISQSNPLFSEIANLVEKTFNPKLVGHGRDATGLRHDSICVCTSDVLLLLLLLLLFLLFFK